MTANAFRNYCARPSAIVIVLCHVLVCITACDSRTHTQASQRQSTGTRVTALSDAIGRSDVSKARELLNQGPLKPGESEALAIAAFYGNLDITELLVNSGASIEVKDEFDRTPLMLASENDHPLVIEYLVRNGAVLDPVGPDVTTPLMFAAQQGNVESVKMLLKLGADPNGRTPGRINRPLHLAAERGHTDVIRLLFSAGARINEPSHNGLTPLMWATSGEHWDAAKALVEAGADPNVDEGKGITPLHQAALHHRPDMVRLLLKHGARADKRTNAGRLPSDQVGHERDPTSLEAQEILRMLTAALSDR